MNSEKIKSHLREKSNGTAACLMGLAADYIESLERSEARLREQVNSLVSGVLRLADGRVAASDALLSRLGPISNEKLLSAWREYCQNPASNHPCENFKAGFVAANLISRGEEPVYDSITDETRKMKF